MPQIGEIRKSNEIRNTRKRTLSMWVACDKCGKERWVETRYGKPRSKLCRTCSIKSSERNEKISASLRRDKSPKWKGGTYIHGDGYNMVYLDSNDFFFPMISGNNHVLEHRLVMAKHLGRCLQTFERVHHKNGNRQDNRIENLELIGSQGEHSLSHSKGYRHGYQQGLYDGRLKQIQKLKDKIKTLNLELEEVRNVIK